MTDVTKISFNFQFLKKSFSKLKQTKKLPYLEFFISFSLGYLLPSCFLSEILFLQNSHDIFPQLIQVLAQISPSK